MKSLEELRIFSADRGPALHYSFYKLQACPFKTAVSTKIIHVLYATIATARERFTTWALSPTKITRLWTTISFTTEFINAHPVQFERFVANHCFDARKTLACVASSFGSVSKPKL